MLSWHGKWALTSGRTPLQAQPYRPRGVTMTPYLCHISSSNFSGLWFLKVSKLSFKKCLCHLIITIQCLLFSTNKTSSQTFSQLFYIQSSLYIIYKEDLHLHHKMRKLRLKRGTSLVIQWLRLPAPNAGGPGSVLVQGTRSCMPQCRSKILRATTKIWYSQLNKYFLKIRLRKLKWLAQYYIARKWTQVLIS